MQSSCDGMLVQRLLVSQQYAVNACLHMHLLYNASTAYASKIMEMAAHISVLIIVATKTGL